MGEEAIVTNHTKKFIRDMGDETGNEFLSRATEGAVRVGVVVEIAKGDVLTVVVHEFGLSNRGTAEIAANIFDILVMVFAGLLAVHVPVCGTKFVQQNGEAIGLAGLGL